MVPNSKIIFFGTPDISATVLEALIGAGYEISLVITNADKPIGRKQIITPSPVKNLALNKNIPVLSPEKLDDDTLVKIKETGADLGIVVAYGHIIPQIIIDTFPKGLLNIHYSLLPKYRGASPVENAILSGDKITGVTIQKLVFKLDAGPIVAVKEFEINDTITSPELKTVLTQIGIELLIKILPDYLEDKITPITQNEDEATFCKKISKSDAEIKLSDSCISKWLKYRAYFGWPGIFYFEPSTNSGQAPKRVKITEAVFEDNKFIIKKIIPEGKKEISI